MFYFPDVYILTKLQSRCFETYLRLSKVFPKWCEEQSLSTAFIKQVLNLNKNFHGFVSTGKKRAVRIIFSIAYLNLQWMNPRVLQLLPSGKNETEPEVYRFQIWPNTPVPEVLDLAEQSHFILASKSITGNYKAEYFNLAVKTSIPKR